MNYIYKKNPPMVEIDPQDPSFQRLLKKYGFLFRLGKVLFKVMAVSLAIIGVTSLFLPDENMRTLFSIFLKETVAIIIFYIIVLIIFYFDATSSIRKKD